MLGVRLMHRLVTHLLLVVWVQLFTMLHITEIFGAFRTAFREICQQTTPNINKACQTALILPIYIYGLHIFWYGSSLPKELQLCLSELRHFYNRVPKLPQTC